MSRLYDTYTNSIRAASLYFTLKALERYEYKGKANSIVSRNELCKFDITCNDIHNSQLHFATDDDIKFHSVNLWREFETRRNCT
jgi:hypothetical protein